MGIPQYFGFLLKQYNNIIINNLYGCDRLFLDLNCAIHGCASRVLSLYENKDDLNIKNELIEEKIIESVYNYILFLYSIAKPRHLIYIAIDGVAPRAKMNQQRIRRYKSAKDKKYLNSLKDTYDKDYIFWDTNAITPGTLFMEKLNTYIYEHLKHEKLFADIQYIFSDSNVPGEGEHKMFDYIKKNDIVYHDNNDKKTISKSKKDIKIQDGEMKCEDGEMKNYIDVIYGLDADLIMLSILSKSVTIYLMRESTVYNGSKDDKTKVNNDITFIYVDINILKKNLISEFNMLSIPDKSDKSNQNDKEDEFTIHNIYDYVFICFFLGNDFIPHSTCINIYDNGIFDIIKIYITCYLQYKTYLINRDTLEINGQFLVEFIKQLSLIEDTNCLKINTTFYNRKIPSRHFNNEYEKKLFEYDNYPIINRDQDLIQMGTENWRDRYYKYNFNLQKNDLYRINNICCNYLESIKFTFLYYFDSCPSWCHYYRYHFCPTFYDLYSFILGENNEYINNLKIINSDPYTPLQQLLIVLPPSSNSLLPKNYSYIVSDIDSPLIEYYPVDFQLITYHKKKIWECIPNIPDYDDKKLLLFLENKNKNNKVINN